MLLIVIAIGLLIFAFTTGFEGKSGDLKIVSMIVGFILIVVATCIPIHGYNEPTFVEEYELISLKPDSNIWVIEADDGTVMCKYVVQNENNEADKDELIVTFDELECIKFEITEEGSKPVLRKYLAKPKISPIVMPINCDVTEYVFYVPESCIVC